MPDLCAQVDNGCKTNLVLKIKVSAFTRLCRQQQGADVEQEDEEVPDSDGGCAGRSTGRSKSKQHKADTSQGLKGESSLLKGRKLKEV